MQVAGKWVSKDSRTALEEAGLETVKLQAKEGLSLINGMKPNVCIPHTNRTKHGDIVFCCRAQSRVQWRGN